MSAYNFVRSGPSSQIFLFNDGKIVLVNAALSGLFCADVPLINYSLTYFVLTIVQNFTPVGPRISEISRLEKKNKYNICSKT